MTEAKFNPFPVLTTERLVLRQLQMSDDQDIFTHRSDSIVNTYLEDFRHLSIEDTKAFIERVQREISAGKTILWVITERGKDKFIGTICFWNISWKDQTAETGYTLVSSFHKMGYMHEAMVRILDFGFDVMKLHTVEAYTHRDNNSSIRLLLRNGFKQGTPRKPVSDSRVFFSLTHATSESLGAVIV